MRPFYLESIGGSRRTIMDNLQGKNVRVLMDSENRKIKAIGHITKDKWFNPGEEFKEMEVQHALGTAGKKTNGVKDD